MNIKSWLRISSLTIAIRALLTATGSLLAVSTTPPHLQPNKLKKHRLLALLIISAMALTACGGGGGGGGVGLESTLESKLSNPAGVKKAAAAAEAIPKQGSVTQSSNTDGSGVTLDEIDATASYDEDGRLRVSVTSQRAGSWGTVSTDDHIVRQNLFESTETLPEVQHRTLGKQTDDGVVFVDVYTDRESATDMDYLVGGLWLFVPDAPDSEGLSGLEIGAFMDGPSDRLTPSTYIQASASATYRGEAAGIFLEARGTGVGTDVTIGEFVADVGLTANFGSATPSIDGAVSNFRLTDVNKNVVAPVPDFSLTLEAAEISQTAGGFFTDDTVGTYTEESTTYDFSGKWGGQFYGDEANYLGGTFGGSTESPGYELGFVGVFGAEKQ